MKLVHKSLILGVSVLYSSLSLPTKIQAQDNNAAEYLSYYNPALGFQPAQTSLSKVFLQLAASLEREGSPVPYIRHMQAEHKRVSALYKQKTGKQHKGRMPTHMTEKYLDQFIANWNALSPKLGLDAFAREIGRCAREGMRGTRNTGTIAIEVFNAHQDVVISGMQTGRSPADDFESLRLKIKKELEFGKERVTMVGYDASRRDAVSYSLIIQGRFATLFSKIDTAAAPAQAAQIKDAVFGIFMDLARLAHSEFEIGMLEYSLTH